MTDLRSQQMITGPLRFLGNAALLSVLLSLTFWMLGYHIIWAPTKDQLYGCTVENEAPNGECK